MTVTQLPSKAKVIGKTKCGGPIGGPFDKARTSPDTSSHGTYVVSGDLFGQQVHIDRITATRAKQMEISGDVKLNKLALETLVKSAGISEGTLSKIKGELWRRRDDRSRQARRLRERGGTFVPRSLSNRRRRQEARLEADGLAHRARGEQS